MGKIGVTPKFGFCDAPSIIGNDEDTIQSHDKKRSGHQSRKTTIMWFKTYFFHQCYNHWSMKLA